MRLDVANVRENEFMRGRQEADTRHQIRRTLSLDVQTLTKRTDPWHLMIWRTLIFFSCEKTAYVFFIKDIYKEHHFYKMWCYNGLYKNMYHLRHCTESVERGKIEFGGAIKHHMDIVCVFVLNGLNWRHHFLDNISNDIHHYIKNSVSRYMHDWSIC